MPVSEPIRSVQEPFKIFVGDNTVSKLWTGFIDQGKATVKGGTSIEELEWQGGDISFPNYWEAWGRRVISGKPVNSKGEPVEVNDSEYKGEIEFLDNKSDNGYIIYCRYITGQNSLDYDYQVMRLNLITKEKDEKNLMFNLERGEHKVNPTRDKAYALALKVHPMNQDSRYKTSRYKTSMYKEVNVFESNRSNVKQLDIEFTAGSIVREASSSFLRLKVLHSILCADGGVISYDVSDDNNLYDVLILFAKESPEEVLRLVAKYKEEVSKVIEIIKAHDEFDGKKDGTIALGKVSKKIWMTGVSGKNLDEMLQNVFSRSMEPEYHEKINELFEYKQKNFK